jgi:hypothetical protein
MKNRKLHSFAAYACGLLLTLMMTSIFVSCSDDEDEEGGGAALSITSLTPAKARVGETVIITGAGFGTSPSQNTVMFKSTQANDAPALVQEATATTLKVTVPASAASGSITVTVAGKSITSPEPFTLDESQGAPVLTSLNPTSGFVNAEITITGSSFGANKDAVDVLFGAVEATEIVAVTATTVKVKVPASLPPGAVAVKVVREGVSSTTSLTFTVNATPVSVKTVYWSNGSKIFRGAIDDTGIDIKELYDDSDRNNVQGVAIDVEGGYIYWGRTGGVSRAPLDGAGPIEEIYNDDSKLVFVQDIAIDHSAGAIYFTSIDATATHSYINKGSLDGNSAFTTLIEQDFAVVGVNIKLTVEDGVLYWASAFVQEVNMASLSGTFTPTVLFTSADGLKGPVGVAIDKASGKIFITDSGEYTGMGESRILQGNLDGSGTLTPLVPAGSNVRVPYDTEIDTENGYIFWLNSTSDGGPASDIMRVKLDGTGVEKLFDGFDSGLSFDIDVR